jgi:hypothetical protein
VNAKLIISPGLLHLLRDRACIDEYLIRAAGTQQLFPIRPAACRCDNGPMIFGNRRRGQPDRCRAATDQQTLALGETERPEQRAPGGLQHLREGTQSLPRKVGFDHLYLTRQHAGIFRVPPVEIASHAAHGSGNDLALGELPSRSLFDEADGLDAEDPREDDTRRQTLPGEQLGPVQTERLDPDQNLTRLGR